MESLRSSGDFRELLSRFNDEGVRYLIVGGFALAHFGQPRYTKDLDIWIDPCAENAGRVFRALAKFGAPLDNITVDDLSDTNAVFQIGVEPVRVDILPGISGVVFNDAWNRREASFYGDVPVQVIGREDYICNKRASGRPHDLRDVAALLESEND
ncbi:MAG TPA: nucleotidyltransferase [Candidatus Tumulicola sp.]|nr:nucleotidyltransferase [Candidatus Tumulicola sp.]